MYFWQKWCQKANLTLQCPTEDFANASNSSISIDYLSTWAIFFKRGSKHFSIVPSWELLLKIYLVFHCTVISECFFGNRKSNLLSHFWNSDVVVVCCGVFWWYCGWLLFVVVVLGIFGCGFVCFFKKPKTDLAREHSVWSEVARLSFCDLGATD